MIFISKELHRSIIVLLLVLVVIVVGGTIYFFWRQPSNVGKTMPKSITPLEIKANQQAMQKAAYDKQFSDLVTGTIRITSDAITTLTTKDGVQYAISPSRPKSFYRDSGIKSGELVKVQGKITGNSIALGSVVPAKP